MRQFSRVIDSYRMSHVEIPIIRGLPALGLLCMHVSERSAISWEILFFQIHMPQTIDCLVRVDVKHMQQGLKMCGGERLQRGSTSEHARGHHAAP